MQDFILSTVELVETQQLRIRGDVDSTMVGDRSDQDTLVRSEEGCMAEVPLLRIDASLKFSGSALHTTDHVCNITVRTS